MSKVRALYHIVFGTHKRLPSITDQFRKDLYMVILGIIKDYKVQGQVSRLIRIGGIENHVHLLIDLHSMMALAPLVGEIKRRSSLWMKEQRDRYPLFDAWSREYYAATLAEKDSGAVIEYINHQQEHHHGAEDYEEELKRLVEDAGLTWHPDMIED
jgi:putative transposase